MRSRDTPATAVLGHRVADEAHVAPQSYSLDALLLQRPGNDDIQFDLFLDCPSKQHALSEPRGAKRFEANPNARVRLLDAGHVALEMQPAESANEIRELIG